MKRSQRTSVSPQSIGGQHLAATQEAKPASSARASKPATVAAVVKPEPSPEPPADKQSAVSAAVERWAQSWQSKDLPAYYAAYAPNFKPEKGMSLVEWQEQRRTRIFDKEKISVKVHALQVKIDGDQATARFRQHYTSGSLDFDAPKTLLMQRLNGKWLIVREIIG